MAEIKFTDEELGDLTKLQDDLNNIILHLGQLDVEEINIKNALDQLVSVKASTIVAYSDLRKREKELAEKLNAKYGAGTLNPKSGIFTPAPPVVS